MLILLYPIFNLELDLFFCDSLQGGEVVQETITSNIHDDIIMLEFQRTDGTLITQLIDFRSVSVSFYFIYFPTYQLPQTEVGDSARRSSSHCPISTLSFFSVPIKCQCPTLFMFPLYRKYFLCMRLSFIPPPHHLCKRSLSFHTNTQTRPLPRLMPSFFSVE
jgi:hypothetical protein